MTRYLQKFLWIAAALCLACCVGACGKSQPKAKGHKPKPATLPQISAQAILQAAGPPRSGGYDIFAIRVGETRQAEKKLFLAESTGKIPIAFSFWVIAGGGKTILVDTGFASPQKREQWKVEGYRSPDQGLAAAGIASDSVTDIVITHGHWDHIGGIPLFARAKVWMVRQEYEGALKRFRQQDPDIYQSLARIRQSGNLNFTEPIQQLFPGVAVVRQGKHTANFQYVVINNADGPWILASDEGPLYENFQGPKPSGQTKDPAESLAALKTILSLAGGRIDRIIPGHDPEVYSRYPQIAPGVAQIAKAKKDMP